MIRLTALALYFALCACSTETTEAGDGGARDQTTDASLEVADPEAVPESEPSADELAIIKSFRALKVACVEKDSARAHELFAPATRQRWVHIKGLALHAEKEKLRREGLMVQLAVLVLRAKAGFETLETLDEVGMLGYALSNNLLGNQMIATYELDGIHIDGDVAESGSKHGPSGRPQEMRYGFVREDGVWRVDLTPAYEMANQILAAKLATTGIPDEEEALYFLVGNATGTGGTAALWTPLSDLVGR